MRTRTRTSSLSFLLMLLVTALLLLAVLLLLLPLETVSAKTAATCAGGSGGGGGGGSPQTYRIQLEQHNGTLSDADSPRRGLLNWTLHFSLGTIITAPVRITVEESNETEIFKLSRRSMSDPLRQVTANATAAYDNATGELSDSFLMLVRHANANETNVYRALRNLTFSVANVCGGKLLNVSATLTFQRQQIVGAQQGSPNTRWYEARDACNNSGLQLPTILKRGDHTYLKSVFAASNPNKDQWLGNLMKDLRTSWGVDCWSLDTDYDSANGNFTCSTTSSALQYFSLFRSKTKLAYECTNLIGCPFNAGQPDYDTVSDGAANGEYYSVRLRAADNFLRWQDSRVFDNDGVTDPGMRTAYYHCARADAPYKWIRLRVADDGGAFWTQTPSHASASLSATMTASPSATHSLSASASRTKSNTTWRASPTRVATKSRSESGSRASPSHSGTSASAAAAESHTAPTPSRDSASMSRSRSGETASAPRSRSRTYYEHVTPSRRKSASASRVSSDSRALSESPHADSRTRGPRTSRSVTRHTPSASASGGVASESVHRDSATVSRTISLLPPPPPLPTIPVVLPVAAEATIAATTTVAAIANGPAAAQALRAMSIIATVTTGERCKLTAIGKDQYASDPRRFPESFLPALAIRFDENSTNDRLYGLPTRRGVFIANALLGPLVIGGIASIIGLVRKRLSPRYSTESFLTAGRVPGLVAALTGMLGLDGIFANAMVFWTLPGGADAGDIVLSVVFVLVGLAVVCVPGAFIFRAIRDSERAADANAAVDDDRIECVPAVLRCKRDKTLPFSKIESFNYLLFGNEVWSGPVAVVERYRSIFAVNRGWSREYEHRKQAADLDRELRKAMTKAESDKKRKNMSEEEDERTRRRDSFDKWKKMRRQLSTWSFWIDVALVVFSAMTRGWVTTRPCHAHGKAQFLLLTISVVAFVFACAVAPCISPMRRYADIAAGFMMCLASWTLIVFKAEAAQLVGRCAMAAAFLATASAMALFFFRRIVLPLRGLQIVSRAGAQQLRLQRPDISRAVGIADLFSPLLDALLDGDGEVDEGSMPRRPPASAPSSSSSALPADFADLERGLMIEHDAAAADDIEIELADIEPSSPAAVEDGVALHVVVDVDADAAAAAAAPIALSTDDLTAALDELDEQKRHSALPAAAPPPAAAAADDDVTIDNDVWADLEKHT